MHERGKNSNDLNDEFSRVKDLSALFVNSDIQTHDRFWFKSDIIRLMANMCYNNQEYQTLVIKLLYYILILLLIYALTLQLNLFYFYRYVLIILFQYCWNVVHLMLKTHVSCILYYIIIVD